MSRAFKYSFLMPYFDRHNQLSETLDSFIKLYKAQGRDDFEIIIVEDKKNADNYILRTALEERIIWYSNLLPITHIRDSYLSLNSSTKYNMAAKIAKGKYFIITNPETIHEDNILKGFDEEFANNSDVYIVCACRALKQDKSLFMWYQHSVIRNCRYHFCSAISKKNYFDIGGFDEAYKDGYCFEDDDFRDTIEKAKIRIITRDDLLVSHQWHSKAYRPTNWRQLWKRNKDIYEKKFGKIYQEY